MKNKKFAIGIPTLNRKDLLLPSLNKYIAIDFPNTDIYIVDNGHQDLTDLYPSGYSVHVTEMPHNIGVAASWNSLCDQIFKDHEFALILNDDIYSGCAESDIDRIVSADKLEFKDGFNVAINQWCAFLFSKDVFSRVGRFDESFYPAYFEDNDYAYRIKLLNIPYHTHASLMPEIYKRSSSLEKDPTINDNFQKNFDYYVSKWGGSPGKETFTVPFNEYQLSDDILLELGFGDGKHDLFVKDFGEGTPGSVAQIVIIHKEAGLYYYKVEFSFGKRAMWQRFLRTKKDVQDLVLGLTGKKI